MTIEIEDKTIEEILKKIVKEEIDFLGRELIRDREVRFVMWCWLLQNFYTRGLVPAGIKDDELQIRFDSMFTSAGVPMPKRSGGGGGADTAGREDGSSGGGGIEPPVHAGDCKEGSAPKLILKA